MDYLVDSNVLIDLSGPDDGWRRWSEETVERCGGEGRLIINPISFAEASVRFSTAEMAEAFFKGFVRENIPWTAAFLAGKAFVAYRAQGGAKTSPLPDFFIGAHAAVTRRNLITRDAKRYRHYFPNLTLVCPD